MKQIHEFYRKEYVDKQTDEDNGAQFLRDVADFLDSRRESANENKDWKTLLQEFVDYNIKKLSHEI